MKGFLKTAIVTLLYRTGILVAYARVLLRNKCVVLTYHRVLPAERQADSFSAPGIVVTPGTFRMHMALVRRLLHPLSGPEFADMLLGSRPFPSQACLITFDDGWYDNLRFALPILREHRVPALLFAATSYIGGQGPFWQERLARLLFRATSSPDVALPELARLGAGHIPPLPQDEARSEIRALVTRYKKEPDTRIASFIEQLCHCLHTSETDIDFGEDRFLSWEELRELTGSGVVSIGSHGCSHTPLTQLSADVASDELVASRSLLERRLGVDCATFAFPNGDFDDRAVSWVQSAGYKVAFTTVRGHTTRRSDPLRIKRINIHESATRTPAAFLARVVGLF